MLFPLSRLFPCSQVLIRCNNVLYIRAQGEDEDESGMKDDANDAAEDA
jgi:hypothetical protein